LSTVSYDSAGNVTNDGTFSYTWNAEGRMVSAAGVTYTYDGDGKRVKKDNGKLYWYGPGGEVLAESDLGGNITSEYIYFGGQRIARKDPSSSNVYYYLGDRLGSARVMVSITLTGTVNGVVSESDYYPYGGERVISNTLTPANNYKFTGHERDGETGLDHALYRQYSSTTGRWLSEDPYYSGLVTNPTLDERNTTPPFPNLSKILWSLPGASLADAATGKDQSVDSPGADDPSTWDRYSYTAGNPANRIDLEGNSSTACNQLTVGALLFGGVALVSAPVPAVAEVLGGISLGLGIVAFAVCLSE
jgi:RHS repeat-associated protein